MAEAKSPTILVERIADLQRALAEAQREIERRVQPTEPLDVQAFIDAIPRPKDRLQEYADAFAVQAINAYLAAQRERIKELETAVQPTDLNSN